MRRRTTLLLVCALALGAPAAAGADEAAPPSLCEPLLHEPVDTALVLDLLEQGADPLEVCTVAETSLVWSGGTHILRDLSRGMQSSGGDPIGKGIMGLVLLPLVPVFGIIDALSALGSGPTKSTRHVEISPLHLAVQHAPAEVAEALADAGAPLDQRDGYGVPPIVYAMERAIDRDQVEPARVLFERGASLDVWTSLDAETVRTISRSPDLLALACTHGLDVGARDPASGGTALHLAVGDGDQGAVRALVECGADPEAGTSPMDTPLMIAARQEDGAMMDVLIELGADVDHRTLERSDTGLVWATREGELAAMAMLLERGADADVVVLGGSRPLHEAARERRGDATQLLLEHGADPAAERDDGETPLRWAVRHDCVDCAEALLEHDAPLGPWARDYARYASGPQERVMTRVLVEGGLAVDYKMMETAVLEDQPEHAAFLFEHDTHKACTYGRLKRFAKRHGTSEETVALIEAERLERRPGPHKRPKAPPP